eukprot:gene11900-2461_t
MESYPVNKKAENFENEGDVLTLESLPDDAILQILFWLQPQDLALLCLVCKRLRALANSDSLWKGFARQFTYKPKTGGLKKSWKEVYCFGKKWNAGSLECVVTMNLAPKNLMPWIWLNNQGNILMVSQGTEIFSYSSTKLMKHQGGDRCILSKLSGHTSDVTRFTKVGNFIYSASLDKTVCVWTVKKKPRRVAKLSGHQSNINCIQANQEVIVSGSRDESIKVWSSWDYTCLDSIDLEDQVRSLCLNRLKSHVIVGMSAHNVKYGALRTYDLNRGRLVCDLTSNGSGTERLGAGITQLALEDAHTVLSCGYDTTIRLWDLRTRRCVLALYDPHDNAVFCFDSNKDWMVVSGTSRHGVDCIQCCAFRCVK